MKLFSIFVVEIMGKEIFLLFKITLRGRAGVARVAHNHKVGGSNPPPATKRQKIKMRIFVSIEQSEREEERLVTDCALS